LDEKRCKEHSGIVARLLILDKAMVKFEAYMEKQNVRTLSIMIGIILCLLTGFISIYVSTASSRLLRASQYNVNESYVHRMPTGESE